jgi:protein TonB
MIFKVSISFALFFLIKISSMGQTASVPATIDTVRVFTKVETPASFAGGSNAWRTYLENNLHYPKKAFRKNIQGVVRVQFIVSREGYISDVVALNDPGGGLAEEAVRIIQTSPRWAPAEQNQRKVIYRHIQSITFRLE